MSNLTLPGLAKKILAHHADVGRALGASLWAAKQAGDVLVKARKQATGPWSNWCVENLPDVDERTIRTYIRIADNWDLIKQRGEDIASLSIRGALRLLEAPKPAEEPESQQEKPPPQVGDAEAALPVSKPSAACPNCGHDETNEDGECAKCFEPDVGPERPLESRDVIDVDSTAEDEESAEEPPSDVQRLFDESITPTAFAFVDRHGDHAIVAARLETLADVVRGRKR